MTKPIPLLGRLPLVGGLAFIPLVVAYGVARLGLWPLPNWAGYTRWRVLAQPVRAEMACRGAVAHGHLIFAEALLNGASGYRALRAAGLVALLQPTISDRGEKVLAARRGDLSCPRQLNGFLWTEP